MGFSRQEYWSGCHCLLRGVSCHPASFQLGNTNALGKQHPDFRSRRRPAGWGALLLTSWRPSFQGALKAAVDKGVLRVREVHAYGRNGGSAKIWDRKTLLNKLRFETARKWSADSTWRIWRVCFLCSVLSTSIKY